MMNSQLIDLISTSSHDFSLSFYWLYELYFIVVTPMSIPKLELQTRKEMTNTSLELVTDHFSTNYIL